MSSGTPSKLFSCLLIAIIPLFISCSGPSEKEGEKDHGDQQSTTEDPKETEKADIDTTELLVHKSFSKIEGLELLDSSVVQKTARFHMESTPAVHKEKPFWKKKRDRFDMEEHSFLDTANGKVLIQLDNGEELSFPVKKEIDKKANKFKDNKLLAFIEGMDLVALRRRHYIARTDNIAKYYHFISKRDGRSFKCKGLPLLSPDTSKMLFHFGNITHAMTRDYSGGFHVIDQRNDSAFLLAGDHSGDREMDDRWGVNSAEWKTDSTFRLEIRTGGMDSLPQVMRFKIVDRKGEAIEDGGAIHGRDPGS